MEGVRDLAGSDAGGSFVRRCRSLRLFAVAISPGRYTLIVTGNQEISEHDRGPGVSVPMSPQFLAAIRKVEALPSNRDGADKSWVGRLLEQSRLHFLKVERVV